jgi:XapX domain-containing protein
MKIYLVSLGAGVLVGIIYSLLHVRSPAPPVVALIGLLGMLIGKQVIPVARHWLSGYSIGAACQQSIPHVFGMLPGQQNPPPTVARSTKTPS